MLMQKASPKMVKAWKAAYSKHRARLKPNNRSASEIMTYVTQKYPLEELPHEELKEFVRYNILNNECYERKIPVGRPLIPHVFHVEHTGSGNDLYENQDDEFKGYEILVGFELETGYFLVEGSNQLWDEIFLFRGLDEYDIDNAYLVSEYIDCLKKAGQLDSVLTPVDKATI